MDSSTTIDKSTWGEGPWQNEPEQMSFEYKGYSCEILRNDVCGFLLGYVDLPEDHPWCNYGLDYDDIFCEVHGGLTYKEGNRIGFDMGHLGDICPGIEVFRKYSDQFVYKDFKYVVAQIEHLVDQAIEARNGTI